MLRVYQVNALDSGSDYIATVCALSSQGCESRVAELTFSTYDVPDGFRCYLDGEHRCGNLSVNKEGLEVNTETEGSILCELPLPQCGQAYWEVLPSSHCLNPNEEPVGVTCCGVIGAGACL